MFSIWQPSHQRLCLLQNKWKRHDASEESVFCSKRKQNFSSFFAVLNFMFQLLLRFGHPTQKSKKLQAHKKRSIGNQITEKRHENEQKLNSFFFLFLFLRFASLPAFVAWNLKRSNSFSISCLCLSWAFVLLVTSYSTLCLCSRSKWILLFCCVCAHFAIYSTLPSCAFTQTDAEAQAQAHKRLLHFRFGRKVPGIWGWMLEQKEIDKIDKIENGK